MNSFKQALLLGSLTLGSLVLGATGCATDGFCFDQCAGEGSGGAGGGVSNSGGQGGEIIGGDAACVGLSCVNTGGAGGGDDGGGCVKTNDGVEICDGIDNDCDDQIDEPGDGTDGVDFTDPTQCGNCDTNCTDFRIHLTGVTKAVCVPPTGADLGVKAGTCDYEACAANQWDRDGNRGNGCEYYCADNPDRVDRPDIGGNNCGIDDDCDTQYDEDVNTCNDVNNCGACGFQCVLPHATGVECRTTATGTTACDTTNTGCFVTGCESGWVDANGAGNDGCEYACTPTNNGVEICDGIDNDCDKKIDNADDSMNDPAIGVSCQGGDNGVCADPAHAGVTKCIDQRPTCCDTDSNNVPSTDPAVPSTGLQNGVCTGVNPPFVISPNELQEVCDNADNDCDGTPDNSPIDEGGSCGPALGACIPGKFTCVAGALQCIGGNPPQPEVCDAADNDCDGVIDGTKPSTKIACSTDADCATHAPNIACLPLSNVATDKGCVKPPTDIVDQNGAILACDVPVPPPTGVAQPCKAGTMACFGGTPLCQGSIKKQADLDRCFEDTNCDGVLDNQANLTNSDPKNCGSCGNDCSALGPNATWDCNAGVCTRVGCKTGFIECGGASANDCETSCTFQFTTEVCDGLDNDCDCQVDEGTITPPSPIQACGVASAATDPGCTAAVTLACVNGGWNCTFTDPDYCSSGSCTTTPDKCDGKDNNCDGVIDEPFVPPAMVIGFLGQACYSDDAAPVPGDGPCRTQGIFVCKSDGSGTQCGATKDLSKAQLEKCDNLDNDCDGQFNEASDLAVNEPLMGDVCYGGTQGICALATNAGTYACVNTAGAWGMTCTGNIIRPGEKFEVCNGLDDDCDGTPDNKLTDEGAICGSSVGTCTTGTEKCVSGKLTCQGNTAGTAELCDGKDNDCDGQIDDTPTDVGGACNVPPAAPSGATTPCKAGVFQCIGSTKLCVGSIVATQTTDNCFEDTNCNGVLENQSNLKNGDPLNCGTCGNDCNTKDPNAIWSCVQGVCQKTGCKAGHIDCDGDPNTCERACTFTSSTETCNGVDDNCDCQIDNNPTKPTPVQACGVSPSATDVGCTSGVTLTCTSGAWQCTFTSGYCTGGNCSTMLESCDGKDNNCNGVTDESFKYPVLATGFLGAACTTPSTDGPCQGSGVYICNGAGTGTQCNAVKDTSKSTPELCDGKDNDCDGTADDSTDVIANDTRVNKTCYGGTQGECIAPAHAGTTACVTGAVVCQGANLLKPDQQAEICDNKDNDCDGQIDDSPTDVGGSCGSGTGACVPGTLVCQAGGTKVCQGGVTSKAETCNNIDDDCDGTIDNNLTDTGKDCSVPPPAPAPTAQCATPTEFCKKGTLACSNGILTCSGSVTASASTPDGCCVDSNCDGALTNQPDFQTDVNNCGGCGIKCGSAGSHGIFSCQSGACVRTGCSAGYINCDGNNNDCERACTFSGTELCNGVDDNCDCQIDNGVASVPTPSQVCGVSATASDPKCLAGNGTTGVLVACTSGAWKCTFPSTYCDKGTPAACSTTPDICDGKDNNCNGNTDENYKLPVLSNGYINQPCASDDGKPPPGDGQCRTTGTYQCSTTTSTACNAVRNDLLAGAENCDGVDNDCDGSVDESFKAKGTNATYFVKPAVVKIPGQSLWVYEFEASRPNATGTSPGNGNGYWCTGAGCSGVPSPTGSVTLDSTRACSVSGKIPWFNVTPVEVEQTCQAMGGSICSTANWTTSCQGSSSCKWGYYNNCTTAANYTTGPFCNLGPFDFDGVAGAPNSDGLLITKSGLLNNCLTNYGLDAQNNPFGLFDITGNLREITKRGANDYPLMGGAFNTQAEDGAQCSFSFYSVATSFSFFDTGFRCCFTQDPTL